MKRTYKLAADPIERRDLPPVREILEFADGHRSVFAVVANDDALDVLQAIRRAYQDGREDRAEEE